MAYTPKVMVWVPLTFVLWGLCSMAKLYHLALPDVVWHGTLRGTKFDSMQEASSEGRPISWSALCYLSPGSPSLVDKPNGLCTWRSGVRATALAQVFRISRGLSRHSPVSEVLVPKYLAGFVSTHG